MIRKPEKQMKGFSTQKSVLNFQFLGNSARSIQRAIDWMSDHERVILKEGKTADGWKTQQNFWAAAAAASYILPDLWKKLEYADHSLMCG